MRCGLLVLPEDLTTFGELCRTAEEVGFDFLGVGDSQSVFRDVWVALSVAAMSTSTLRLGPQVTNPVSRHLVVTASAASSLDELSGGRAVLGVGSGDSALYTVGAPPSTVAGMERALRTLRELTAGRQVVDGERVWQVHRARRSVPLYLSAEGPRTLRLAGRLADGVVVGLGISPDAVEVSLRHLAEGAAEAGRRIEDIDVWWLVKTTLGPIDEIKMALAASANHAFRFTLEGKALAPELWDPVRALQAAYRSHDHEVIEGSNAALVDRFGLTEYLADRFAFWGGPDQVLAQMARAEAAGAEQFLVTGIVNDPLEFTRRWGREILPELA
ncbi:MAG: LLM class flavin-dependent oxidoreductase [Acidimicrobiia bacterium]|nr:LLM class flavin-dependent oxidoreductase [Acidimicrobiia bacterium]